LATEHYTQSSTAAPPRGHLDRTFESPRQRLLAGLPVNERQLSLNGVTTAVLEGGEGAQVVLLHGPGGVAVNFGGVFQRLAVFAGWVWIALLAVRVMRDRKAARASKGTGIDKP
jgi:hypothetical protein